MTAGPIPFAAIDQWARRYGVDDLDDFEALTRAIRAMDKAFMEWAAEQGRKGGHG